MKPFLLVAIQALSVLICTAQNVGIGTTTPDASAQLDVNSTQKGILFPRVTTTQRNAIASPATGLMVFDVEKNLPYYFNGLKWMALGPVQPNEVQPVEYPGYSKGSVNFGKSVAMTNGWAAVGAPGHNVVNIANQGAVQIYKKTNGQWSTTQLILAPDGAAGDNFGYSIDMQGEYLVIGAPYKTVSSVVGAGKVYIYKLNTSTGQYVLDGQATHPDGNGNYNYFGWSVTITDKSSVTGSVVFAAGAPQYIVGGTRKGTVSVFRRSAANSYVWLNTINGTQTDEQLGAALDMDKDLLVMGAPAYDSTRTNGTRYFNAGRVQVNRFVSPNYSTVDAHLRVAPDTSVYMGMSVAIDSTTIVTAGIFAGSSFNSQPYLYFRNTNGSYTLSLTLPEYPGNVEPEEEEEISMGYKLAVTQKLLLMGIPHKFSTPDYSGSSINPDYTALFRKSQNSQNYTYYSKLVPSGLVTNNTQYGTAVAAFGSDYIISMGGDVISSNGENYGAVFFGTIEE